MPGRHRRSTTSSKGRSSVSSMVESANEQRKLLVKISKDFNHDCLLEHNRLRAIHCVPKLKSDGKLMKSAQKHAEQLAQQGKLTLLMECRFGQNIAAKRFVNELSVSGTNVARKWYEESGKYDYETADQWNCKNFTQMVWKKTERIGFGCALDSQRNTIYIVGHYNPPGNITGRYNDNVLKPGIGDTAVDGWNLSVSAATDRKDMKRRLSRRCERKTMNQLYARDLC